jgi:membrane protease YdiL (CAAX protease family)
MAARQIRIDKFPAGALAIFVALVLLLTACKTALVHALPPWSDGAQYLVDKILRFAVYLVASAIMARLEAKSIGEYGLPVTRTLVPRFLRGAVISFFGLTAFLLVSRATGLFHFGSVVTRGFEAWKWCAIYAVAFLIVAVEEEFQYRGYLRHELARGVGFWPAAIVSSAVFAYGHIHNPGETWLGIVNLFLSGLLFCLLLKRSGDLWLPIGFHASWDWAQTYIYGIPDSGRTLPGHLLGGNFSGPFWLSGGTVGPEGSAILTLLLILFLVGVARMMGRRTGREQPGL